MLYYIVFVAMSLMILQTVTYYQYTIEGGGGFACCGGELDIEAELLAENGTLTTGASNKTTDGNLTVTKFLSIQHAQSGSISEINTTAYSIELKDVSDKTILFSDRPERIVTSIRTLDFVGNWSIGEDSFAENAPNAVLIVDDTQRQDTAIIELFNPVYDTEKKILKYEINPDNVTSVSLPKEFGRATLIIDAALPTFGGGGLGL